MPNGDRETRQSLPVRIEELDSLQKTAVVAILELLLSAEEDKGVPEKVLRYVANCALAPGGLPSYTVTPEEEAETVEIARQIAAGNFE